MDETNSMLMGDLFIIQLEKQETKKEEHEKTYELIIMDPNDRGHSMKMELICNLPISLIFFIKLSAYVEAT